jgi:prepilin-type N-terminal cleavage/methylation domain-containing protein
MLAQRPKNILRGNGGFTLVEMAISVVVLTIIISVILLVNQGTVSSSRVAAATEQLRTVRAALVEFTNATGYYPISFIEAPMPNYMPVSPDPNHYSYQCSGTGTNAILKYAGTDNAEATAIKTAWAEQVGSANVTIVGNLVTATLATAATCK